MTNTQTNALEAVVEALQWFDPFRHMETSDMLVMATKGSIERAAPQQSLFSVGDKDPWMYCLMEGTVELTGRDGRKSTIVARTPHAVRPLSPLRPRLHSAKAVTPIAFVRLDISGLLDVQKLLSQVEYGVYELPFDNSGLSEQLQIHELSMMGDGLHLPSLPEVALRAQQLIDRDDADLKDIAKVVTRDPALTAKLLKAANSAMYRGTSPAQTCEQAITRIGTKTARQLITAFAVRGLFESDMPELKKHLRASWEKANEVAAISYVLARLTKTFKPEEALLAGLLHDIGVLPIFGYVARHPALLNDEGQLLEQLLAALRVRAGISIVREWKLPEYFEVVVRDANDWWRDPAPQADLADLVVVAKVHSYIGKTSKPPHVPSLPKLPAFKKMAGDAANPRLSAQILEEAAAQVAEVKSIVGSA